jgi:hypothetical protein
MALLLHQDAVGMPLVGRKYLLLYIAEFELRYNHSENADIFRNAIAGY